MSSPSIRRSLLIRCGLGIGILLCLLSASIYLLVEKSLYGELDDSIRQTAAILSNQVELENDSITYEWQEGLGTNQSLVEEALFQFWNDGNGSTTRSPALKWRDLPKFSGVDGAPLLRNIVLSDGHHARAVGLRVYPFLLEDEAEAMRKRGTLVDPKSLPQTLVVARDVEPSHRALERLRWILIGGSILTLGFGYLLIERAVKVSLKPIHQLSDQVQDRAEHQIDQALAIPENLPAELTGLAGNFNLLLSRVALIRQREKDFIRHAAHELRTPIAGLRATTDLALSQKRDADAYAAHLAACQKSAVELGELVKRLSALARIGEPASPAVLEAFDATPLLRECWQPFAVRAGALGITTTEPPSHPLQVMADLALLRIILNNLFDNAVSYTRDRGHIAIRSWRGNGDVMISVRNSIDDPPEDLDRLFEPLFRREGSRHDATSHLGIGLTLSLEAARAMGATIKATQSGGEICFTLTLQGEPGGRRVPS